jgi:hypothetical protein
MSSSFSAAFKRRIGRTDTMQKRRRRISPTDQGSGMGSQMLSLSLFVMLLAFFIILNAISSFESAKVRPALESVEYAFSSKMVVTEDDTRPSIKKSKDLSIYEGDSFDRIKALFNTQIPGAGSSINRSKGEMFVTMSYDDLAQAVGTLEAGNTSVRGSQNDYFVETLVALIDAEQADVPYHMSLIYNVKDNPARMRQRTPQELNEALEKISGLAGRLREIGIPDELTSAAVQKGKRNEVELVIRPHIRFDPASVNNGL